MTSKFMTAKHFQFIADVLKEVPTSLCKNGNESDEYLHMADQYLLVAHFADELEKTNPLFKRDLFLKACGINTDTGVVNGTEATYRRVAG